MTAQEFMQTEFLHTKSRLGFNKEERAFLITTFLKAKRMLSEKEFVALKDIFFAEGRR